MLMRDEVFHQPRAKKSTTAGYPNVQAIVVHEFQRKDATTDSTDLLLISAELTHQLVLLQLGGCLCRVRCLLLPHPLEKLGDTIR